MSVFTTKVQSIGPEAELFKEEKMVILFGKRCTRCFSRLLL